MKLKLNQTALITYLPSERFTYKITRVRNTPDRDGWTRGTCFSLECEDSDNKMQSWVKRFDVYLDARAYAEEHHKAELEETELQQLEAEGMTRSDAQGILMVRQIKLSSPEH